MHNFIKSNEALLLYATSQGVVCQVIDLANFEWLDLYLGQAEAVLLGDDDPRAVWWAAQSVDDAYEIRLTLVCAHARKGAPQENRCQ